MSLPDDDFSLEITRFLKYALFDPFHHNSYPPEATMADTVYETGTLYHLNISDLKPDPDQPRKHFDKEALKELTESIIIVHGPFTVLIILSAC